jgi:hypothetical protein
MLWRDGARAVSDSRPYVDTSRTQILFFNPANIRSVNPIFYRPTFCLSSAVDRSALRIITAMDPLTAIPDSLSGIFSLRQPVLKPVSRCIDSV